MKATELRAKTKRVKWNGDEISPFESVYNAKINYQEIHYDDPDVITVNPATYHEMMMDEALVRFGNSNETFKVFGVKLRVNNNVPEGQAIATSHPKMFSSNMRITSDSLDSFMYATMKSANSMSNF